MTCKCPYCGQTLNHKIMVDKDKLETYLQENRKTLDDPMTTPEIIKDMVFYHISLIKNCEVKKPPIEPIDKIMIKTN